MYVSCVDVCFVFVKGMTEYYKRRHNGGVIFLICVSAGKSFISIKAFLFSQAASLMDYQLFLLFFFLLKPN